MVSFASRAPLPAGGFVPIKIAKLTYNDALVWHQQIQPDIRKLPDWLDDRWHWPSLLLTLSAVESLKGRELVGYVALIENSHGLDVPAGAVLLSVGFPALDQPHEKAVYLWYLTTAPTDT